MTQVTPLKGFYRAGDCHQDYALHNPNNRYIQACDLPKIKLLKEEFPQAFRGLQGQVITPAFKVAVRV
jgi:peptide-methionine (S)-S-oxide reductase